MHQCASTEVAPMLNVVSSEEQARHAFPPSFLTKAFGSLLGANLWSTRIRMRHCV